MNVNDFVPSPEAFRERFQVGVDGEPIHPVDMSGVILASIQALHEIHREQETEMSNLEKRVEVLTERLAEHRP